MPYLAHWILSTFLKKKWGQWCRLRDIGQNIEIFGKKKQGWFYSNIYNLRQLFSPQKLIV